MWGLITGSESDEAVNRCIRRNASSSEARRRQQFDQRLIGCTSLAATALEVSAGQVQSGVRPGSIVATACHCRVGWKWQYNTSAPCYGDVILHVHLIRMAPQLCAKMCCICLTCPKKLMPCSPFVKKGCSYTLEDDKGHLRDPKKNLTLSLEGHDVGGLYFECHSRTVRVVA